MKKKQRSTAEEIFSLIQAVEQKEMSQDSFCRKTGLKACSYHYWLKKYRSQHMEGSSFIELPKLEEHSGRFEIEVELRSGVKLRFSSLIPVAYLRQIIQQAC